MSNNKTMYRVLFGIIGIIVLLLVIFNFRTRIPFSIGIRLFQIPFFFAFAIAYIAGAASWALFTRRLTHNKSKKKEGKPPRNETTETSEAK